ncbi:NAD(P)/FAD-dependent oxidoreductase [Pseudanabaena sp. UWO310]|uniref:NAD(P)/FAD-dependent oxidoreductase n=1 Tax=Pseudanabaena sp. UWO310 TaxID=2480795 RepID=UPI001160ADC4|nr:FAD-binding oxidoreductase [Pseudanabaena sp. UWO310]TYQ25357.1 FAD-binding oxidoreductase [Pseudanabaena sp. UWO310]
MHDWIVIGGGITGISLSYELQKAGFSVLLIEQHQQLQGGSSLGYGGISYWSGTTAVTQQLCQEGIARQRNLSHELGMDTEFREIDLLLTLTPEDDRQVILSQYKDCAIAPTFLNPQEAIEREPQLNKQGIGGALLFPHAHINLSSFVKAHSQAFQRLGGETVYAKVTHLLTDGDRLSGVSTAQGEFRSAHVAVCAGAMSRILLKASGVNSRIYYTHAEAIDTEPVDLELRAMVMPADNKRNVLEGSTTDADSDAIWDVFGRELLPPSIDAGAVQYNDRRIRFGQLSRVLTDPHAAINAVQSEAAIRAEIAKVLPKLAELKGKWRNCLVAFSSDNLPLVGSVQEYDNLHLFSGFTSPTVYVPALSQRFAAHVQGKADDIIPLLSPKRFDTKLRNGYAIL